MISVIIPVFNGEKYLDECLSSIRGDDVEIIVVDDESNDNSYEIARKYTNNVIKIKHAGPVVARNMGLQHAHGEFIVFMDADDILKENALSQMENNIDVFDGVIGLRADFISPDCPNINVQTKTSNHGVIAGCAMFKKSVFDKIGDFDSELLCGDGFEWLMRTQKNGIKFNKIDSVLCMRRIHNNNMGRTMQKNEKQDYIKIIKKHFIKK